jgi:hypothetical protein
MTKDQFKKWSDFSTELGLTPTPGKSYFSNKLITFCSQYYYEDGVGMLHNVKHLNAKHMTSLADGKVYNSLPDYAKQHYKRWCLSTKEIVNPYLGQISMVEKELFQIRSLEKTFVVLLRQIEV